ncbi:predicted protein [Thalassiosira pseudonana CCMP1335]|uniref:Cas1p 10 TM acyl transferase domain-containing protein n=1 Tax=Thalassiosira pseudonana TaxID=35128 RepID=B8C0G0_THAPS|nr:predicted protein [Thalassiosira pseudonana CCMP1335]EED93511.1 predicted protein [Thalassiosira pseudonana CCMP1335]
MATRTSPTLVSVSPLPLFKLDVDPLDGIAPSTVAMIILFGSLTFATVGMAAKAWMTGDKREYHDDSTSVQHLDDHQSIRSSGSRGSLRDRSVGGKQSGTGSALLKKQSDKWNNPIDENNVYDGDNSQGERSIHRLGERVQILDQWHQTKRCRDLTVFWTIVIVFYAYFVSWRRNDGRQVIDANPQPQPQQSKSVTTTINESPRKQGMNQNSKRNVEAASRRTKNVLSELLSDGTSVASKDSSQESGLSRRLEEVLLDDVLGHEDHETIDETVYSEDDHSEGWVEKGSKMLGLDGYGLNKRGVVRDAKPEEDVMNGFQTLEIKGFLSVAMLIFQYNNDSQSGLYNTRENNDDYVGGVLSNLSKVGITSFIFLLTGYHHSSYYYYHPANAATTNPKSTSKRSSSRNVNQPNLYGVSRVLSVLAKMNVTAVFLSLVLGDSPLKYTLCSVHSFFFVTTWLSLMAYRSINYDKYKFRMKMFVVACIIFISDFVFTQALKYDMPNEVWELCYISHLNRFTAFAASLQLRKLESSRTTVNVLAKSSICLALAAATFYWSSGPLQLSTYNMSHPYFGLIPLLTFVYWRNSRIIFREHHIAAFAWIGRHSLEIYLLASTFGKTLVLWPGYPRCNFSAVSGLILYSSRLINDLVQVMRQMLLPENNEKKCIKHVLFVGVGTLILYWFGLALCWADMVTTGTMTVITIISGLALFQTVMDETWTEHASSSKGSKRETQSSNSPDDVDVSSAIKTKSRLLGAASVLLLVVVWYGWSALSGLFPSMPMDASCADSVNDGLWVPINSCLDRGILHRDYNAMNFFDAEVCVSTAAKQWGWPANPNMHCGFRYRSDTEIQARLRGKRLVVIGDSSVRSLYHSLCRSMGDGSAGGYEGISSHYDSSRTFGSTTIDYKWAPLSFDVVAKLKNMRNDFVTPGKHRPDIILAGGGLFDKLHLSSSEEDLQFQREVVINLAAELRSLREAGIAVIWFSPPTVNTRALNSDEKRTHMSEERLAEMRQLYVDMGVTSSASFVLEGPGFTCGKVNESYDGIHFPNDVYDAGVQVLANAFTWLIEIDASALDIGANRSSSQSNPYLGLMMLSFALVALFFFDGYFGFSFLAQVFVTKDKVSPPDLYQEAFAPVFIRLKVNEKNDEKVSRSSSDEDYDEVEMLGLIESSSSTLSRRR